MRPTNCKNCASILTSDICEYCGTDYSDSHNGKFQANLSSKIFGTIMIGEKSFDVYLSGIETHLISNGCERNMNGDLFVREIKEKKRFILMEK